MDIFDYAMQLEEEGESLYREIAHKSLDDGLCRIMTWLADQENKHYQIFKAMKEKTSPPDADAAVFFNNVKSVFSDWQKNKDRFNFEIGQADLYRKGLDVEKRSIKFYSEKAGLIDQSQKLVFQKIINEEKNHFKVLENLIELITKPERWVEHAEFSHIGEEY